MTSSRWPKNVLPPKGRRALGDPIREDSPAERMTAASTWAESARDALGGGFGARLYFCLGVCRLRGVLSIHCLMRQVGGSAANGDQLRGDADGDLFGRERADFEAYG